MECPHFGCRSFEVFVSSVDEHGVFEDSGCVAPTPFRGYDSLRSTEFPPSLLLKNKSIHTFNMTNNGPLLIIIRAEIKSKDRAQYSPRQMLSDVMGPLIDHGFLGIE